MDNRNTYQNVPARPTKYCKYCAAVIPADAVVCTACGRQVEELKTAPVVVNNTNVVHAGDPKNKWVALLLWFFLGVFGGHKFYEGKIGMGILYIFTLGLFGIGLFIDLICLLCKPTTYYV